MKKFTMVMLAGIMGFYAHFLLTSSCFAGTADKRKITVKELYCEYVQNPLAIETSQPRFSWIMESSQRSQMQSAFHIIVASTAEKLAREIGDKWDSGKIASDHSVNIIYRGKRLSSGEKCYWKVRVWDKDGQGAIWSETASFEMGLLQEGDWQAKWIGSAGLRAKYIERTTQKDSSRKNLALDHRGTDSSIRIIRKIDGTKGRWLLAVGKEGPVDGIYCGFVIDGKYYEKGAAVNPALLTDEKWHLATAAYDGSYIKIYFDGIQFGSWAVSGSLSTLGSGDVWIGSYDKKNSFQGSIDDVRIYSRSLADDEIANMYNSDTTPEENLVGWWEFDGDLRDSSGHENHGLVEDASAMFSPLLRKEFHVDKTIQQASVHISGLGWCELYINGNKISDRVLDPAATDYDKRIFYVTHDVTDRLQQGANAVSVMLGNGWFCPAYCPSPRLLLQMHIQFKDGTTLIVKSDESWKVSEGPIGDNSIIKGEVYDARKEKPDWVKTGFNDSGWGNAVVKAHPGGILMSQMMPSIKVRETLNAVSLTHPAPGVYLYDFGKYFGGWARFHFQAPRGHRLTIKYAPLKLESGFIKELPEGRSRDVYICKGDSAGEVYEPRFTFHPVRYVQIENYPGTLTLSNVTGKMAYNDVDTSSNFSCSNALLNQIHAIVLQTTKNALYGIELDTLNREIWGWLAPGSTPGMLYPRVYMPRFCRKYCDDAKYAQHTDGVIPDVIPAYPVKGRNTGDPAWAGNYPMLLWYTYQYYGDKRLLEEHYETLKKWVNNLRAKADGYVLTYGYYGEHMIPGPEPGKEEWMSSETPYDFIKTAFYYHNTKMLAQVAQLLGHTTDAAFYSTFAENIKNTFNNKWFNKTTKQYGTGSQTCNLLPLVFEMVPGKNEPRVARNIVENIVNVHNGHHHTGNMGTCALMQALTERGYGDIMYSLVNRTDYPGWGFMVAQGSTTVWESWGAHSTDDDRLSMPMFNTVDQFLYSDLAGLKGPEYHSLTPITPAFKHITIRPYIPTDMTFAEALTKTVRGNIFTRWEKSGNVLTVNVTIPVNATAKVSIPKLTFSTVEISEGSRQVWDGSDYISGVSGLTGAVEEDDYVTVDTGSGSYLFTMKQK